jgi:integrase
MSPASAKGYFTAFSALMRFAVDRGYRSDNPAERLRVRPDPVPARRKRDSFSTDQLRLIFNAPLYRGCKNDAAGYNRPGPNIVRRGRFWVPVIGLYTGMRLGEICQLEVSDVVKLDGVEVVLVGGDDDDETKRVKTEAGNRYVPVHPDLKKFGLLDHHAKMAAAGERRLFPELTRAKTESLSDNFSKWFSGFLEAIDAKTKRTSFHSFRHTYRDALREADISRERVQALGGWSSHGTDEIYGNGPRPSTLAREIEKVRFRGLTFPTCATPRHVVDCRL